MLKRLLLAALCFVACNAHALEYTDVYYDPAESGWGLFLVQSDTVQFVAFFIYGADGKPTWYTAQLTDDGTGQYTGSMYATTGSPFGSAWNPGQLTVTPAGTATFHPLDRYHATLTYTVNGVATVVRPIQRQTLTSYPMAGRYSGSMAGSISGCTNGNDDPAFRARYVLDVAQDGDTSAALTFTFVDQAHNGIVCTATGPLAHFGRLYQMPGAMLVCSGPGQDAKPHSATIESLHPTGQGLEGRFSATATLGGGCSASLHFAGVLNVNN
jgi:hypothetical protein